MIIVYAKLYRNVFSCLMYIVFVDFRILLHMNMKYAYENQ